MRKRFFDLAFTPAVRAQQTLRGSRAAYSALAKRAATDASAEALSEDEKDFIKARDSFYLATVSESGWPYVRMWTAPDVASAYMTAQLQHGIECLSCRTNRSSKSASAGSVGIASAHCCGRLRRSAGWQYRTTAGGFEPTLQPVTQ